MNGVDGLLSAELKAFRLMSSGLEVSNLHLWRGDRHVLRRLSFALPEGRALQLLWPNGAGKTSLLRTLAGFLHPDEGTLRWNGRALGEARDEWHRDVAWLGHDLALKADLTPIENLAFVLGLRRAVDRAWIEGQLVAAGLPAQSAGLTVRRLSAGQQRRVALARLAAWNARVWLLDEPAANLDAAGQDYVAGIIDAHLLRGGLALIATHQPLPIDVSRSSLWRDPAVAP